MKLIALGDNVIDYYRNTRECFPGGNAVNVAVHAARQGVDAEYLGCFGGDKMAQIIMQALKECGVIYEHCPVLKGKTTKVCLYDVVDGERSYIGIEAGESWTGPIKLGRAELDLLSGADVVVSSCNAKIPEQLAKVQELPPVFVYDFGEKEKYRTEEYYDQVCGCMELAMLSCDAMEKEAFAELCRPLHARGVRYVLGTMGACGEMVSTGETIIKKEPRKITVNDTMGAGDSFLAAFVCSLWNAGWKKGKDMDDKAILAALGAGEKAAAENCGQQGGFGWKTRIDI